jgi:hypothetical protein
MSVSRMLHAFVGRWIAWLQLSDAVNKDFQSYSFSFSRSLYVSLLHLFQLSYVIFIPDSVVAYVLAC